MAANFESENLEFKENLPLLPIRDIVVYPFMIIPLFVGRESSIQAVEESLAHYDRLILLASQKDIKAEHPHPDEIFELGTVAMIMRMRKLPDGRIKILIQGLSKARILAFEQTEPFFQVKLQKVDAIVADPSDISSLALMRSVREQLERVISLGKTLSPDILMVLEDISEPGRLADLIASNLNLRVEDAQNILETLDPIERLKHINEILAKELEILSTQAKLRSGRGDFNRHAKDQFLKEQMRAIKNELGEGSEEPIDEIAEIKERLRAAGLPPEAEKEANKVLSRVEKMHPDSSESAILRNYLETLYELPWSISSEESLDLELAKKVLDEDHFDLEKIKERILEYLAVRRLKGKGMKGPILCFAGPPGVGKTSLGKSIAKATGRSFVRISLGGVKDEAEIRGHRRTYVGALPGRFIQAIKQAKTNNPVIMLDEIDKVGSDFRGDPSSALLEVLDPEQNNSFRDHYLNLAFDLSNVMFIATANEIDKIPNPLRDRMEVIYLSGYTQEEKVAITKKYLIPKQMDENGICEDHIEFSDDGVKAVIQSFTREAGLRNLERQIGALCRKVAKKIATGSAEKTHILDKTVEELLGPPMYTREDLWEFDEVGVCTGLAWTSAGGEILSIEASMMKGKGLTLTGQLGDVMKESARAAIGYIRSKAEDFDLNPDIFDENEIHLHIPAGATPKDGPSAGITMGTALISLLTGLPISKEVAMTGEITLTGKVLPIGGLKEKALAAMRMGVKKIIIPWKNKKDLADIPEEYLKELEFIPVKFFEEVLGHAVIGWNERFSDLKTEKVKKRKSKTKNSTNSPLAA